MIRGRSDFSELLMCLFGKLSTRASVYEGVVMDIKVNKACLVPFTLKQFEKYETVEELIRDNIPRWLIREVDHYDLNYYFLLAKIAKLIDEQDQSLLVADTDRVRLCCMGNIGCEESFQHFVGEWYVQEFECERREEVYPIGFRYAEKCLMNNRKVSLSLPSFEELKRVERG